MHHLSLRGHRGSSFQLAAHLFALPHVPVEDKVGEALPRELLHVAVEALPIAAPLANLDESDEVVVLLGQRRRLLHEPRVDEGADDGRAVFLVGLEVEVKLSKIS